jgi:hypothetical protein
MTKKLNSFTASQASTSTLPRLSFKRNQPKPEILLKFGPGFSRRRYIAPMLSSGKIAATGQPIALILMRAFDAVQSPRQGLCAVLVGAGMVALLALGQSVATRALV